MQAFLHNVRTGVSKGGLAFGAAAALLAAGIAGTKSARGTPAYGEQRMTPAMLTPGEFVMNSQAAQLNGPALQAMNMGGVAFRQDPTGVPGYKPKSAARRIAERTGRFGKKMATNAIERIIPDMSGQPTAEDIDKLNKELKNNTEQQKTGNKTQQQSTEAVKQNTDINDKPIS